MRRERDRESVTLEATGRAARPMGGKGIEVS
jgi:hypothetical protein